MVMAKEAMAMLFCFWRESFASARGRTVNADQ
jgi:hypothetical protein